MPNTYFPTKQEFEDTIERKFEKIVSEKLPALIRDATAKEVYTIKEVCELLNVSRRHLQYLRDTEQLTFIKNGRKIYFRKEDLDEFFDQNLIKADGGSE